MHTLKTGMVKSTMGVAGSRFQKSFSGSHMFLIGSRNLQFAVLSINFVSRIKGYLVECSDQENEVNIHLSLSLSAF